MANKISINFGTICKRSSCINSVSESIDANKRYNNLNLQLKSLTEKGGQIISPSIKSSLKSFIESINNVENANKYYRYPLYIIQEINSIDKEYSNYILTEYIGKVLPYVSDLSQIDETIERYELDKNQKEKILESAKQYEIVDRILANHEKISKRFNIALEVSKVKGKGLRSVVHNCCAMIDTYTIAPYAKMNLCFEEMGYLFDKSGIQYDRKEFVKYVTEYFLLRSSNLSLKDIKGYRTVLNENCYINPSDTELVSYAMDPDYSFKNNQTSISKEIEKFLISQEKTLQQVEDIFHSFNRTTWQDIKFNTSKLLWLVLDIFKSEYFKSYKIENYIPEWFDIIIRRIQEQIPDMSKEELLDYADKINKFKECLIVTSDDNYEYACLIARYKKCIDELLDKINTMTSIVYYEANLNAIDFINSESEGIPINEYKIFKFNNLVAASKNLDKYLKYKAKMIYDKGNKKVRHVIRRVKDILFGENMNIYSYIGEDLKGDICVAQYYYDESCLEDVHRFFNEVCSEFNNNLICEHKETLRSYYIINPGIVEVHLKEHSSIIVDIEDFSQIESAYNESLDVYIEEFTSTQSCLEALEMFDESALNIQERLTYFFNNPSLDIESFKIAMEALSLLDIEQEQVNVFAESFGNYRYNNAVLESVITESEYQKELYYIRKITENWKKEIDVPLSIQVEAFQILSAVLEANPNTQKPKVNPPKTSTKKEPKEIDNPTTKVDESRKNPFKGINLNTMKLYLEGLKNKMKQMSTKEKELSRNLDNNFRRLVKSMKDALISDRREAIIKGSVIPSLSKCIKIAVGLAGLGVVTGNPIIPLMTAIGGFAVSKRLTQKERILLLDEIETELEVLDKEIAMAESKNQMKKLRTLLKYKKDLQRQYQRIRYNVRVGKDILPGSTAGIKNYDNE